MAQKAGFIILVFWLFAGCSKNTSTDTLINSELEWSYSYGGFSGSDTILPSAKSKVTLIFKENSTYILAKDGRKLTEGKFYTIQDSIYGKVYQFENFMETDNLWFQENGVVFKRYNNNVVFMDYNVSEPYYHKFKTVN